MKQNPSCNPPPTVPVFNWLERGKNRIVGKETCTFLKRCSDALHHPSTDTEVISSSEYIILRIFLTAT